MSSYLHARGVTPLSYDHHFNYFTPPFTPVLPNPDLVSPEFTVKLSNIEIRRPTVGDFWHYLPSLQLTGSKILPLTPSVHLLSKLLDQLLLIDHSMNSLGPNEYTRSPIPQGVFFENLQKKKSKIKGFKMKTSPRISLSSLISQKNFWYYCKSLCIYVVKLSLRLFL